MKLLGEFQKQERSGQAILLETSKIKWPKETSQELDRENQDEAAGALARVASVAHPMNNVRRKQRGGRIGGLSGRRYTLLRQVRDMLQAALDQGTLVIRRGAG